MPITHKIFKLDNGLKLIFVPHREADSVYTKFLFLAGSNYEKKSEIGVAHFLEHILFDGTEKYPTSKDLENILDRVGGQSNAATSREWVDYRVLTLKEDIEVGFEYLSQIILHPALLESNIKREKTIIEQEIKQFKDDPEAYSAWKSIMNMFPNSRLGLFNSGDIADIEKVNLKRLEAFLNKHYSVNNCVLAVAGNVDEKNLTRLANKYFSPLSGGHKNTFLLPQKHKNLKLFIENRQDLNQTKLVVGFYTKGNRTELSEAINILNIILGSGIGSRLIQLIREQKGYAYSIGSSNIFYANHGIFEIYAGLEEKNVNEAIRLIHQELHKISETSVSERELQSAIKKSVASLTYAFERPAPRANYYSYIELFDVPVRNHLEHITRLKNVTKEDVLNAAKEIFTNPPIISLLTPTLKKQDIDLPWS